MLSMRDEFQKFTSDARRRHDSLGRFIKLPESSISPGWERLKDRELLKAFQERFKCRVSGHLCVCRVNRHHRMILIEAYSTRTVIRQESLHMCTANIQPTIQPALFVWIFKCLLKLGASMALHSQIPAHLESPYCWNWCSSFKPNNMSSTFSKPSSFNSLAITDWTTLLP